MLWLRSSLSVVTALHSASIPLHSISNQPATTTMSDGAAFTESIASTVNITWPLLVTIALSGSLTLLNKAIYQSYDFPYPFYLLSLHFGFIAAVSRILVQYLRPQQREEYTSRVGWGFWSRNVLPVGLFYGGAILAGNLAYTFLSVSFVQMLKAFTPVLLVVVTSVMDGKAPPVRITLVVLAICGGVAIAAFGEVEFVLVGVLFQVMGSCCEVGRLVATQRLLQDLKVDPLVALSQLSPICFVMAICLAPVFEGVEPVFLILPRLGLGMVMVSIVLALLLNIAVLFLVSITSALILTLTGILKDIILITGSVVLLDSKVSKTQWMGYGIATCGLIYFRFSRSSSSTTCSDPTLQHSPSTSDPIATKNGYEVVTDTEIVFELDETYKEPN